MGAQVDLPSFTRYFGFDSDVIYDVEKFGLQRLSEVKNFMALSVAVFAQSTFLTDRQTGAVLAGRWRHLANGNNSFHSLVVFKFSAVARWHRGLLEN